MAAGKKGAPAWMVSFGDMMTLILTFFILLVSLSSEQQAGLVAKGVGSFIVSVSSFGLDGVLSEEEKAAIFRKVRVRFNLPPEEEEDRRTNMLDASSTELVRAAIAEGLAPHGELNQPTIASFPTRSAELGPEAIDYLDELARTLRPARGQVLILEGHSTDGEGQDGGSDRFLAFARAQAVREYMLREHGYRPDRVEARAWVSEIDGPGIGTRGVDARLITPAKKPH